MKRSENRAFAVGFSSSDHFTRGSSLEIGEFGAVVVGRNGAGKTRLVSEIGRSIDVIFLPITEPASAPLFEQIIDPEDRDQTWQAASDDGPGFEHPHRQYIEVLGYLRNESRNDAAAKITSETPPATRRAWETILSIDPDEAVNVATVFVSLGMDHDRTLPHFPYLLAASCEIVRNSRLDRKSTRLNSITQ